MSTFEALRAKTPRVVFSFHGLFVGWGEEHIETSWKSGETLVLRVFGHNTNEKSDVVCEIQFTDCVSHYAGGIPPNPLRLECEGYDPVSALVEFEDSEWAGPRREGALASLTWRHYAVFFINDMYMLHVRCCGEPKIQVTRTPST